MLPENLQSVAPNGAAALPIVQLDETRLHAVTQRQVCQHIVEELSAQRGGFVVTVNLDHMRRCRSDPSYQGLVDRADVVVADGMPLVWACRLQGTPLPERVAGSSMSIELAEYLGRHGKSLFLLGGNPGVAELAGEVLCQKFPGLRIAGVICPPFGFESIPEEMDRIRESLLEADPDVVYVALGSPKQEILIDRLIDELPRAWWLGIGISLSFITGDVSRAPAWMQKTGMEWLHRLSQEPKRLGRRYLIEGLPFAAQLMSTALSRRVRSSRKPSQA